MYVLPGGCAWGVLPAVFFLLACCLNVCVSHRRCLPASCSPLPLFLFLFRWLVGSGCTWVQESPRQTNQRKGQNEKFMNCAHFCEFWCFSLGKQARFTLNFCSRMPLWKVYELTFLWFGLPGHSWNCVIGPKTQQKPWEMEVLHGLVADGVGVKFLIFGVNCSCLPLSPRESRRVREKRRKAKKQKNDEKVKGKTPLAPSTPTPLRTSQLERKCGSYKNESVKWNA